MTYTSITGNHVTSPLDNIWSYMTHAQLEFSECDLEKVKYF